MLDGRCNKLEANFLAFIRLAAIRLWLSVYQFKSNEKRRPRNFWSADGLVQRNQRLSACYRTRIPIVLLLTLLHRDRNDRRLNGFGVRDMIVVRDEQLQRVLARFERDTGLGLATTEMLVRFV